jgi:hypothetical protein
MALKAKWKTIAEFCMRFDSSFTNILINKNEFTFFGFIFFLKLITKNSDADRDGNCKWVREECVLVTTQSFVEPVSMWRNGWTLYDLHYTWRMLLLCGLVVLALGSSRFSVTAFPSKKRKPSFREFLIKWPSAKN